MSTLNATNLHFNETLSQFSTERLNQGRCTDRRYG